MTLSGPHHGPPRQAVQVRHLPRGWVYHVRRVLLRAISFGVDCVWLAFPPYYHPLWQWLDSYIGPVTLVMQFRLYLYLFISTGHRAGTLYHEFDDALQVGATVTRDAADAHCVMLCYVWVECIDLAPLSGLQMAQLYKI